MTDVLISLDPNHFYLIIFYVLLLASPSLQLPNRLTKLDVSLGSSVGVEDRSTFTAQQVIRIPLQANLFRRRSFTYWAQRSLKMKGGQELIQSGCGIYWFRCTALRFHDNPSFLEACRSSKKLLPVMVIDPDHPFCQTRHLRPGVIRANFILESVLELQGKLQDEMDSNLLVLKGVPDKVLPDVVAHCNASHLFYERDAAAPVREHDTKVLSSIKIKSPSITIKSFDTHTLFPMETYVSKCKSQVAPNTYGGFCKIFGSLGKVSSEVETVKSVPPLPDAFKDKVPEEFSIFTGIKSSGRNPSPVPTLIELGYEKSEIGGIDSSKGIFKGGEEEALKRLKDNMRRKKWVAEFEKPETSPNSLEPDTTGLSPYVKHGCISARRFYHALSEVYADVGRHSQPPVSLHGQLMWREYNTLMGYTTPNFDKMVGNPVARQIPWDEDDDMLIKWKMSQTGYPFVDAIMTQLRETGWIHHLARHMVACFLTRGDLWQSWEKGAAVFEEYLIDADWSINNFNWQWLSCSAHFYQYFRCYSPVSFGKKTDKNGDYSKFFQCLQDFKFTPS